MNLSRAVLPSFLGKSPVEVITDDVRAGLINDLKLDEKKTVADIIDNDGHASMLSGQCEHSVRSLASAVNSTNAKKQAHDLALQLALERRKQSDMMAETAKLLAELNQLKAKMAGPHPPSGSGTSPPPFEPGGGGPRG